MMTVITITITARARTTGYTPTDKIQLFTPGKGKVKREHNYFIIFIIVFNSLLKDVVKLSMGPVLLTVFFSVTSFVQFLL